MRLIILFFAMIFTIHSYSQEPIDSTTLATADALFTEADSLYDSSPSDAILLVEKAVTYYQQARAWEQYILGLNSLVVMHYYEGQRNKYQQLSRKAFQESKAKLSTNHPYHAQALNNLNSYYYDLGDYEKSIALLKQSLEIKKNNKASSLDLAYTYNNIGAALMEKGDYPEALEYLSKSLELRRNTFLLNPLPDIAQLLNTSRNNISRVYLLNGQLDLALDYYQSTLKNLQVLKNSNPRLSEREIIIALQNRGKIYLLKKDYRTAFEEMKKALRYQEEDNFFRKAYSFELLGDIHFAQGNYEEAILQYEKAVVIAEQYNSISNLPVYARKLNRLANAKEKLGQLDEAIIHYQKALQVLAPEFTDNAPSQNPTPATVYSKQDVLEILEGKGRSFWKKYQTDKEPSFLANSYDAYKAGIEVITEIRQGIITKEAKNTLAEKTVSIYEGAIRATLAEYEVTKDQNLIFKALSLAERNKSLLLLESINEQTALGIKGLPDSLLQKDKVLRLEIAYYQKQLIEATQKQKDQKKIKVWKEELFERKISLQQLTDYFEENYPRFYQLKYKKENTTITDWQQLLGKNNQGLIEYFVGEKNSYGFVLWAEGCQFFQINNQVSVFEAIETLRNSSRQFPDDTSFLRNYQALTSSAYYLYEAILAPALAHLPKDIHALKIIPDDRFNHIPFDLLLAEKAPQEEPYFSTNHLAYVLENYQISYGYSATLMFRNNQTGDRIYTKDFIAYAPTFKKATINSTRARSCQKGELYHLACSEKEVADINNLLQGDLRVGASASRAAFEEEAAHYRILHLATHACADEENPLFNKIFLTDDYLSNSDLYNTSLNAELVVLSACNTGTGKLVKGEGVLSLARGFVQAGCASSVVSRWSVDDCATSTIMGYFYKELKAGKEKDEALRLAKMKYLNSADRLYTHPYYWSAFVVYGDRSAMELDSFPWIYLLLGFGGLIGLGIFFIRRKKL